jgi:membrane protein YdbS with pleckstrin-like domain
VSIEPAAPQPEVSAAEQPPDASFERLSPKIRIVWFASRAVFWLVVITGLLVARGVGILAADWWQMWVFGPSVVWLIPPIHIILKMPSYTGWGYQLRQHDLLVRRGILTRETIAIPLARIQQVGTSSSLFERQLGLTTLSVRTAGTRTARTRIPGLPIERATELRDVLSRKGHELAE